MDTGEEQLSRIFEETEAGMELTLDLQQGTLVQVRCDDHVSHTFDLQPLVLNDEAAAEALLTHPQAYGTKLFRALFPPGTLASRTLANRPDCLLLVALHESLDAIAWEYTTGPYGGRSRPMISWYSLCPLSEVFPPNCVGGKWSQARAYIFSLFHSVGLSSNYQ